MARTVVNASGMFARNDLAGFYRVIQGIAARTVTKQVRRNRFQSDPTKVDLLVDYRPALSLNQMKRIAIFTDKEQVNWEEVITWMYNYITTHGPYSAKKFSKTPSAPWRLLHYEQAHVFLINGARVSPTGNNLLEPKSTDVLSLLNMVPYATRIEHGWSSQTPNSVYRRMLRPLRIKFGSVFQFKYAQVNSPPAQAVLRGVKKRGYYYYPSISVSLRKGVALRVVR